MRLSDGVEWALHCCTLLALLPPGRALPAARLAEFHEVPPAYLAKHLQALSRAGIIESVPGRRGGYRLARPADDITFWEVVRAVEPDIRAFRCSEIRQQGPAAVAGAAYSPLCGIARVMYDAEAAWRHELENHTLQQAIDAMFRDTPQEVQIKGLRWFQEVLP
jgi:Rrf2 family protein